MSFSELLKQCRKQKGISQAELASKLGVTQQAVGKWESGKSSPDPATVARIAEILSTTADFLLGLYRPVSNVTTPEERFFGNYAESLIPVIGTVKAGYGALAFEEDYGQEYARVKELFQLTLLMSAAIMAAGTVICQVASGQLMGLFTQNPETIAAGQTALRIISIGFVISAVSTTASGALEGLGKGAESLVIALCRYVVFIMPLAALLCNWLGADGAWHAFWITEVLAAVVSGIVYRRAVTHKK